ncbi:MAG: hypothetical protein KC646_00440 [Candidatus Cloacimonetes bacterium]|nr:hypothetical protein [Candidatus Cloacimonadota bacterium]
MKYKLIVPKLHKKLRKPNCKVQSYKVKISKDKILFQFESRINYSPIYFGYFDEVLFKSKQSFELYDGKLCNIESSDSYILINHFTREEIFNFTTVLYKYHPQLVGRDICGRLFIHTYNSQIKWLLYQFLSKPSYDNVWAFFQNDTLKWTSKATSLIVNRVTPSFSLTKCLNHTVDLGFNFYNPLIFVMEFETVIGRLRWEANRLTKSQSIRRVDNNERLELPSKFEFDQCNRHLDTLSIDYDANLAYTIENNNFWDIYKIDLKKQFTYK